jgi:hypothetical protein
MQVSGRLASGRRGPAGAILPIQVYGTRVFDRARPG